MMPALIKAHITISEVIVEVMRVMRKSLNRMLGDIGVNCYYCFSFSAFREKPLYERIDYSFILNNILRVAKRRMFFHL